MGKAARRRKDHNRNYLSELSRKDFNEFETAWDMRIDSWLTEIHYLAKDWARGGWEAKKRIFNILDQAMAILNECDESVYRKYANSTYELLCHECCSQISKVIDRRIYRLSNIDRLMRQSVYKGKKSSGM